jgi:D-aminopeptidase
MLRRCGEDGIPLTSVNPVVCECNDSRMSDIARRPIGEVEVFAAIDSASVAFDQGAVGAGRGTTCYGMKGGIGSSSRLMELDGRTYTMGVLVQSNYGASADFRRACLPENLAESDQGSIILIVATDLPLSARQLRRVLRRTSVGMARLGSYIGHGSGEIAVGFTTAPRTDQGSFQVQTLLKEEKMNLPFRAVGECAEEAILQSMWHAEPDRALDGSPIPSLRQVLKESRL